MKLKTMVERLGGRFSVSLSIDLASGENEEIFKWFLASILFGARISEGIATNTYRVFEKEGVLSPERIVRTGWDGLVNILDRGGYVRYDFKTATKLLDVNRALLDSYGGDLNVLHSVVTGQEDLERRLKALGKGIGDITVNIFLREMRGVWLNANPLPSELALLAAGNLGIIARCLQDRATIADLLIKRWSEEETRINDFADFEAALIRLGKGFCRRRACGKCPEREDCIESHIATLEETKG